MWLKSLFFELGYPCLSTPIVWSDNLAAKSIAENLVFHSRTKHVEIDVHFVREKVEKGDVKIRYVPTFDQVVDILTKGLPKAWFEFLCTKLSIRMSTVCTSSSTATLAFVEADLKGRVDVSVKTKFLMPTEFDLKGSVEANVLL